MKKIFIAFFIILGGSILQTYGQLQVPAGAHLLYKQDFGGNTPWGATAPHGDPSPALAKDSLPAGITHQLYFAPTYIGSNNPPNSYYTLAKKTTNAGYGAWWGNASTTAFDDHTFPGDTTKGYMMIINAADQPSTFFTYPINNLCPNTHLFFSVWAANLINPIGGSPAGTYRSRLDPVLRFTLLNPSRDPEHPVKADTIAVSDTFHIYKTDNPNSEGVYDPTKKGTYSTPATGYPPGWNQCVFDFITGNQSSIELQIFNSQINTNGNDLALDDIEIYMNPPTITVITPSRTTYEYCDGQPMDLTGTYEDLTGTFGGSHAEFMWLYSPNETFLPDSTVVSTDSICTAPAQEGWYKVVIGAHGTTTPTPIGSATYTNCCMVSDPIHVTMIPPSTVLYWNPGATNQNWNDHRNWWLTPTGSTSSFPPSSCTDVHIPGYATTYPALATNVSGTLSACHYIWFHFGGLIGQPHLLQYDSAYVQYNFGKSSGANGDTYSPAPPMSRDKWYALAAPLQRIASGDFSFSGFPQTWQLSFATAPNNPGGTVGTLYAGWYDEHDNTNDWDVSTQYNAIAIYVDGDLENSLANPPSSYQKNLDGLNGIVEMPYYDNSLGANHGHGARFTHNSVNNTSYFEYFAYDQSGFPPAVAGESGYKAPGSIGRGAGDAYKFIFQDINLFENAGSTYSMKNIPVNTVILVGNPFMSDLDFDTFADDNGITFYQLYSGSSFIPYSHKAGGISELANMRYIPPLQSFVINTGSASSSTKKLVFNADAVAVAAPVAEASKLRASVDNTKPDVLYFKAASKAGVSYLTLSMQNVKDKNVILLLLTPEQGNPAIPSLYATDASGQKNSIQFEGGYVDQVPLGLLSSGSDQVTLTVYNKDKVNTSYLTLWDKVTDNKIDLKTKDTYTFTNNPAVQDRFVLLFSNKSITEITSQEAAHPVVNVSARDNTLYVSAPIGIETISVITLQGITVMKENNIDQTTCSKSLQVPPGLYIVSVKLKTGETSVAKVIIK